MCGHGSRHHGRHGFGFRGFGRGGVPNREEWLERLQTHQEHLEQELRNVQELIERLGPPAPQQTAHV